MDQKDGYVPEIVLNAFWPDQKPTVLQLNTGHVHQTLLVQTTQGSYILQRVNTHVFREPLATVGNIRLVNQHLASDPNYPLVVPHLKSDAKGAHLHTAIGGDSWRCMEYVPDSQTIEMAENPGQAHAVAKAFGQFSASLATLDAKALHITIPDFHHPRSRWQQFNQAVTQPVRSLDAFLRKYVGEMASYKSIFQEMGALQLPTKIAHNDPKITNVLFDKEGIPLSIIDLDTVMPGTTLHDFGDMVRSISTTVPEDHPQMEEVEFSTEKYDALYHGFREGAKDTLDEVEKANLLLGAKYMILEQALRFFTDYLNGDVYYKVRDDDHNLIRARNQLQLLKSLIHMMT